MARNNSTNTIFDGEKTVVRISGNLKIRTELQLEFGNLYVSFFLELAHFYQINNTFLQGEMLYQRVLCSSSFKHLYE